MKIKKVISISKEFADKLKELEEVKSITIYGSVAKGIFDKYSDVDIICFCDKIPDEEKRVKKILELGEIEKRKRDWHLHDPFLYKGIHVIIEYENFGDTQKWFDYIREKGRLDKNEESAKIRSHVINSIILYDEGNFIKTMKKKLIPFINQLPESSKKYFNWIKYHYWKIESIRFPILMAIRRKNIILANQIIDKTLEGIIACVYMANKEYYYEPKWINHEIKKFKKKPRNFLKKVNRIYSIRGDIRGLNRKIKLIISLLNEVEKIYKK